MSLGAAEKAFSKCGPNDVPPHPHPRVQEHLTLHGERNFAELERGNDHRFWGVGWGCNHRESERSQRRRSMLTEAETPEQ